MKGAGVRGRRERDRRAGEGDRSRDWRSERDKYVEVETRIVS